MKKVVYLSMVLALAVFSLNAGRKFSPVRAKRLAKKIKKTATSGLRVILEQKKEEATGSTRDALQQIIDKAKKTVAEEIAESLSFIEKLNSLETDKELAAQKKDIELHISALTKRLLTEPSTKNQLVIELKEVLAKLTKIRDALS